MWCMYLKTKCYVNIVLLVNGCSKISKSNSVSQSWMLIRANKWIVQHSVLENTNPGGMTGS